MKALTKSSLLARNTALNLIGQALPLLVAIATIPLVISGMGTERFGIFAMAFVVIGYLSMFNFGLGRTTTKFVSEALGKGEHDRVPSVIWTSLIFVALFSSVGLVLLVGLTPLLVGRVLNIPPGLEAEARLVFYIVSASVPLTLVTLNFTGVLEAYQRFDLINAIKIPSESLNYLIPAGAVLFNAGLPAIMILLVAKNLIVLALYFLSCSRTLKSDFTFCIDLKAARSLFGYGWWVALSNAATSFLWYLDRFLVGTFLTMSAVTYYTAPYQLVSRAFIIPASLMPVLFPAFSALEAVSSKKLQELFSRSFKYMILIMGFAMGGVMVFSGEILQVWLGSEFAAESTLALQILAAGVFFGSLSWLGGTLLQSLGYPKVTALIQFPQIPVYIVLLWLLIKYFGIEGAALARTLRIALTAVILFWMCFRHKLVMPAALLRGGLWRSIIAVSVVLFLTVIIKSAFDFSMPAMVVFFLVYSLSGSLAIWYYGLDAKDKETIMLMRKR
jgi:O-antigen/teichoic acid export membrane protein